MNNKWKNTKESNVYLHHLIEDSTSTNLLHMTILKMKENNLYNGLIQYWHRVSLIFFNIIIIVY